MIYLYLFCSLLALVGVFCLLDFSITALSSKLLRAILPPLSLRDRVLLSRGKKKRTPLRRWLLRTQCALSEAGFAHRFPTLMVSSLGLGTLGILLSFWLRNPFLAPAFALVLGSLPLLYLLRLIRAYEDQIEENLESTLSTITASLQRTHDLISSVEENLPHIRKPLQDVFAAFVFECRQVTPSQKDAVRHLSEQIPNPVFQQWCDMVIASLEDATLLSALRGVVERLSDCRIVQRQVQATLKGARTEFWMMAGVTLGNIPLLYFINRDWYNALVGSLAGKIVLGITALTIVLCAILAIRWTRPVHAGERRL